MCIRDSAQIKKLRDLERRMLNGDLEKRYNKLEVQRYQEEIDSLNVKYSGCLLYTSSCV